MITLLTPPTPQPNRAPYFSPWAETLLRKHGWISVRSEPAHAGIGPRPREVVIVPAPMSLPRPADVAAIGHAVIEGPIPGELATALGVTLRPAEAEAIEVHDAEGRTLGSIVRPAFDVRAIPPRREIQSDPKPYVADHPRWTSDPLRFHGFDASGTWRPLLWARGLDAPICIGDGRRILLGFPLLEVATGQSALPRLNEGYWAHRRAPETFALEAWLADQVAALVAAAGAFGARVERWPIGFASALTVRHDYDRLVSDAVLDELFETYRRLGVRSSWGFLIDKAPRAHAERLEREGHEVMLHSVAHDESAFVAERAALAGATGCLTEGATSHGGLGAPGYLGGTNFAWIARAGMSYSEILGCELGIPAQAFVESGGELQPSAIVLPNQHRSLDLTTKPDGHAFERLARECPPVLERGEHLVVMNHPDIHRPELYHLLEQLQRPGVWPVTFREIASWSRSAKFGARVEPERGAIRFGGTLTASTRVELFGTEAGGGGRNGRGRVTLDVPAGADRSLPESESLVRSLLP